MNRPEARVIVCQNWVQMDMGPGTPVVKYESFEENGDIDTILVFMSMHVQEKSVSLQAQKELMSFLYNFASGARQLRITLGPLLTNAVCDILCQSPPDKLQNLELRIMREQDWLFPWHVTRLLQHLPATLQTFLLLFAGRDEGNIEFTQELLANLPRWPRLAHVALGGPIEWEKMPEIILRLPERLQLLDFPDGPWGVGDADMRRVAHALAGRNWPWLQSVSWTDRFDHPEATFALVGALETRAPRLKVVTVRIHTGREMPALLPKLAVRLGELARSKPSLHEVRWIYREAGLRTYFVVPEQLRLNHILKVNKTGLFWFLAGGKEGRVASFLGRDGDHALMSRVLLNLLE